jgi:hypothetical protein
LREVGTLVSTMPRSAAGSDGAVGLGALVDVVADGFEGLRGVVEGAVEDGPAVGPDVEGSDGSAVRVGVGVVGAPVEAGGEVGVGRSGAPPLQAAASTSSAVAADTDRHVLTPACSWRPARRGRGQGPRGRCGA